MERSILGAVLSGLLGVSSLGSLAFVWSATPTKVPQPKTEGGWQLLDPVTYENITLFPVVTSFNQDTSAFLTLDDGLSSGDVIVSEQGATGLVRNRDGRPIPAPQYNTGASVNQLVLINRGKRPLLLLAGELVSGGKQDRIIAKDRIVAPGADPLPLDVFCVEHGRWTGSSSQFVASSTIVHPSVREKAAVDQEQTKVWSAVAGGTTAAAPPAAKPESRPVVSMNELSSVMRTEAPTQSYDKIYKSRQIGGSVDSFVEELQRRFAKAVALNGERKMPVVGVIVAYGGEVAWSDIFASNELFNHYWSKLLRSYAVEALARPTLREVASRDSAQEFLRRLNGREVQESEPGVYRWLEITEGKLTQIELDALQPKQMTLHRLLLHRTS
jgi:ARG/rhodanese/phosphatase superfamily protein